jgi:protein phosphatase
LLRSSVRDPGWDTTPSAPSGHADPSQLERLRSRSLGRTQGLAIRGFALGAEALERFVRHEPLYRIHECVFGVMAMESEPVDPRL